MIHVPCNDSELRCDVAHFAAILRSEDILTVDDAVEALSDMTGPSADTLGLVSSPSERSVHEVTGFAKWARPLVSLQTP